MIFEESRIRLQYFDIAQPAVGNGIVLNVPLTPGLHGMVLMITGSMQLAAVSQITVAIAESGAAVLPWGCFGPTIGAAVAQNFTCALGLGLTGNDTAGSVTPQNVSIPLPKAVLQTNFQILVGSAQLAGGDQVGACRVLVAFGPLEELLKF